MEQSTIKAGEAFLILLQFIGQASAGSNEFTFFGQSSDSELFKCHVDICNSIPTIPQFCSEDQKRCKDCADVITWCLEPRMPPECKQFCMESIGKEYHKLEEEKPCEGQMIPQIKHGTSDGNHSAAATYKQGSIVNFTCEIGFKLSGSSSMCGPFGQWTSAPVCQDEIWILMTVILGVLLLISIVGIIVLILTRKNWGRKKHNDDMDDIESAEKSLLNNQEHNPRAEDMTDCQTENSRETTPASSKTLPDDPPYDILDGETARKHLSSISENDESSASENSIMPVSEPEPKNLLEPSGALEKFGIKPVHDETKNHADAGIHQTFSKKPQVETTIELNEKAFCTSVSRKQGPDHVPPSIEKRHICKACHANLENGKHTIKETSNI